MGGSALEGFPMRVCGSLKEADREGLEGALGMDGFGAFQKTVQQADFMLLAPPPMHIHSV